MTAFRWAPALFFGLSAPALAGAGISIPLETGPDASIITARYSCAGAAPFDVQYINAGANALVLIPVDGTERVFVQTVSGSGARYVSGALEWWSKGEAATLDDTMTDAPAAECIPAE